MRFDVISFERGGVGCTRYIQQGRVDINDMGRIVEDRPFFCDMIWPTDNEWRGYSSFVCVVLEQSEWCVVDIGPCNVNACECIWSPWLD